MDHHVFCNNHKVLTHKEPTITHLDAPLKFMNYLLDQSNIKEKYTEQQHLISSWFLFTNSANFVEAQTYLTSMTQAHTSSILAACSKQKPLYNYQQGLDTFFIWLTAVCACFYVEITFSDYIYYGSNLDYTGKHYTIMTVTPLCEPHFIPHFSRRQLYQALKKPNEEKYIRPFSFVHIGTHNREGTNIYTPVSGLVVDRKKSFFNRKPKPKGYFYSRRILSDNKILRAQSYYYQLGKYGKLEIDRFYTSEYCDAFNEKSNNKFSKKLSDLNIALIGKINFEFTNFKLDEFYSQNFMDRIARLEDSMLPFRANREPLAYV